ATTVLDKPPQAPPAGEEAKNKPETASKVWTEQEAKYVLERKYNHWATASAVGKRLLIADFLWALNEGLPPDEYLECAHTFTSLAELLAENDVNLAEQEAKEAKPAESTTPAAESKPAEQKTEDKPAETKPAVSESAIAALKTDAASIADNFRETDEMLS